MRLLISGLVTACIALSTAAASAHEFWIEPLSYRIQPGEQIKADLKVGQEFNGTSYPFRPSQFERFELVQDGVTTEVTGRVGDNPALDMNVAQDGLMVIVHETADSRLAYTDFKKFEKFVAHKAFPDLIALHDERGIGREKFKETYRRYAKSLIGVGSATGSDKQVGLKTEIVALANPYTDARDEMAVQVFLDRQPRVGVQVELFEKAPNDDVIVTLHTTDENGVASFPIKTGHRYLVDAVWAEALPNDDPAAGPVWKTHWAALTFEVPE